MKLLSILLLTLLVATGCKDGDGSIDPTDPGTGTDTDNPADGSDGDGSGDRDPNGNSTDGDGTDGNGSDGNDGDGIDGSGDGDVTDGSGSGTDPQVPTNPDCVEKLGLDRIGPRQEVIIGTNTWYPSTQLTDTMMKSNAAATVYVRMRASRCTGFLVSDDVIMTNNHCIANSSEASGVYVRFDWVSNNGTYKQYTCDEFIGTNSALDFTLVRCKGSPGKYHPQVVLGSYQGKTNYPIYVPQQNCDYYSSSSCVPTQKVSEGVLVGSGTTTVSHNADTLGGSSGSPIFDKASHKVIAIHNAGLSTSGGGGTNYGIQMYKIVDYIKDNFSSVSVNSSSTRDPAWDVCE